MHYPISLKKGKNMNTPLISIIIPVYNSEKYLAATLSSVQNQTLQDFEVICDVNGVVTPVKRHLFNFNKRVKYFCASATDICCTVNDALCRACEINP